jgi:hypothetical protein
VAAARVSAVRVTLLGGRNVGRKGSTSSRATFQNTCPRREKKKEFVIVSTKKGTGRSYAAGYT